MHLGVVVVLLALCVGVQQEWIVGVGAAGGIGLNYATGAGSESGEDFVQLLRSRGIGKIRLHDADSTMLHAFDSSSSGRDASIEVIVGMRNDEIVDVGGSPASAQSWVARNVVPYFPATNITAIAVGSEVLTSKQGGDHAPILLSLVPAMKNLYGALSEVGLEKQIKVSAPQSALVLSSYFPPSSATFNGEILDRVTALLDFLASSGSYFMLNLYSRDLQHDGMGLKVEQPVEVFSAGGLEDSQTGRRYSNMFEVLTDALSVAMGSLGYHQPRVLGIDMELSGTSAPSASIAVLIDHSSKRVGGYFDPKFGEDLEINPPLIEQKVRAEAFSSRRFLSDVLQARKDSGTRRRLAPNKSWCVAKSDASTDSLQSALDWSCAATGGGVNCQAIMAGQSCFLPNNIVAHASYAFNAYYQKRSWATGSCDFYGTAQVTMSDPSTASCLYSSSTSANGTPSTPTGTTVPASNVASRLAWDRCRFMLTSFILIFLIKRTLSDLRI